MFSSLGSYLSLEWRVTQPERSRTDPLPPPRLPPRSSTMRDLMLSRVSSASLWISEDFPSLSQIWPWRYQRTVGGRLHTAPPLCRFPWTLTFQGVSSPSSGETSDTTAEREKKNYIDEAISCVGVDVLMGFLETRVSHLADSVHRTGGHRQVSNVSDLRGSTLKIREEKLSLCPWPRGDDPKMYLSCESLPCRS